VVDEVFLQPLPNGNEVSVRPELVEPFDVLRVVGEVFLQPLPNGNEVSVRPELVEGIWIPLLKGRNANSHEPASS